MRITIVGVGAIGGTIGAYLTRAGLDVTLVDSVREHVQAMNEKGLRISGHRGDITVPVRAIHVDELRAPLDVVILAVKAQHTAAALAPVEERLAPNGYVISAQNGLNEEYIASRIGAERTVGCFVHFGADYQEPGHILLGNDHPIFVGELDGRETERVRQVRDVLQHVMPTQVTPNIFGHLWSKMCYGSLAFAAATVDRPFYEVLEAKEHRPVLRGITAETARVAAALGVRMEKVPMNTEPFLKEDAAACDAFFDWMAEVGKRSLKIYTGIQRDIMVRRRRTEVDTQPGAVAERGQKAGVPTPLNALTVEMIKEIEDGKRPLGWDNLREMFYRWRE